MTTSARLLSASVNATFAFLFALAFVAAFVRVARPRPGVTSMLLALAPYSKSALVALFSLSGETYLSSPSEAFARDSGYLSIGLGSTWFAPLNLQVLFTFLVDGKRYVFSVGDAVVRGISLAGPDFASAVSLGALALVAIQLARSVREMFFAHKSLADRVRVYPVYESRIEGFRKVTVHVVPDDVFGNSLFAGGIFRPYLAIPEGALGRLEPRQLEAAILHEMGHISQFHIPLWMLLGILESAFRCIPGIGWIRRNVSEALEHLADSHAVTRGGGADALAEAIVRSAEGAGHRAANPVRALLISDMAILSTRLTALTTPRRFSVYRLLRGGASFLVAGSVVVTVLASTLLTP